MPFVSCRTCQCVFDAKNSEIRRGGGKYCSRKCFPRFKKQVKEANCTCAQCGSRFHVTESKLLEYNFCTRTCKDRAQRIGGVKAIQPAHYKDGSTNYHDKATNHFGYKCNRCGYCKYPIHEVHHKDRDRTNNTIENLEVLCGKCHDEEHYLSQDGKYAKSRMGV